MTWAAEPIAGDMPEVSPAASELMLRRALEVTSTGVAIVRTDRTIIEANPALARLLGRTHEELLRQPATSLVHPDDLARLQALARTAHRGGRCSAQVRGVRGDGSHLWVGVSLAHLPDDGGTSSHIVVQVEDVSLERAALQQLQDERDLSAALLGALREGYVYTVDHEIRQVNDALCELTGFSREELVGSTPPYPVWPVDTREELMEQTAQLMANGGGAVEVVWQRKDGRLFDAAVSTCPVLDRAGLVTGYVTLVRDVSERKARERRLRHRADHDGLTGLLNHVASHRSLRADVAAAAAHGRGLSIAVLDLDRFKDVNDTFGHATGDVVLAEFAARLGQHARASDRLGRIGGEEFLWIMPETPLAEALQAVERVSNSVRETPFPLVGSVTFSAGIADLCQDEEAQALLQRADAQLYVAKRNGRDRVHAVPPPRQPLIFT